MQESALEAAGMRVRVDQLTGKLVADREESSAEWEEVGELFVYVINGRGQGRGVNLHQLNLNEMGEPPIRHICDS